MTINFQRKHLALIPIIFIFAVLMAGNALAEEKAKFILEPDVKNLTAGQDLKLNIKLNTGEGNGTNSYQLVLNYPQDKLNFVSVDASASPFNMALDSSGGNGVVNIIRGSAKTLQGEILIGSVNFKAVSDVSADTIKVSNQSAVINSADNKNILAGSSIENSKGPVQQQQKQQPAALNNQLSGGISGFIQWLQNLLSSFFK